MTTSSIVLAAANLPAFARSTAPDPADLDGAAVDAAGIDARIREILSDPRFAGERDSLIERLLGPLYDWLERMIAFVVDLGTRVLTWLASLLDLATLSWLGPLLVAVAAVAATLLLGRRRAREIERRATIERILGLGSDPSELERMAREAAERGDHAEAIRLRFVAGLLRLDAAGRIEFYPGLSNSQISATLSDTIFDQLADQFDRVIYGRRPATAADATSAEDLWRRVTGVRA